MHTITTKSQFEVFSDIDLQTEIKNASAAEALAAANHLKRPRIVVQATREEVWPAALELLISAQQETGWATQNVLNHGEPSTINM